LRQRCEFEESLGGRGLEDLLHLAGDVSGLVMPEHTQVAGEFVSDGLGLFACGFGKNARLCLFGCTVEEIQTLVQGREVALPEVG
jgi:hypothetical protein